VMQLHAENNARMGIERQAICALIGVAAEERGYGREPWFHTFEDAHTVIRRIRTVTWDAGERSAWHGYLKERARVAARSWWHEIIVVAAVLQREGAMDAASVGATLHAFRTNPFRRDLRPLPPRPWDLPALPPPGDGGHEVELVWQKPTLSQLLAQVQR
jgi:hypothetical protein